MCLQLLALKTLQTSNVYYVMEITFFLIKLLFFFLRHFFNKMNPWVTIIEKKKYSLIYKMCNHKCKDMHINITALITL